jgi:hypothetical protein
MESVMKGDLETPTPPSTDGARSDAASVARGAHSNTVRDREAVPEPEEAAEGVERSEEPASGGGGRPRWSARASGSVGEDAAAMRWHEEGEDAQQRVLRQVLQRRARPRRRYAPHGGGVM